MVALVTQMLDLNKKLQDARLEEEKTMLSRQIEAYAGVCGIVGIDWTTR